MGLGQAFTPQMGLRWNMGLCFKVRSGLDELIPKPIIHLRIGYQYHTIRFRGGNGSVPVQVRGGHGTGIVNKKVEPNQFGTVF